MTNSRTSSTHANSPKTELTEEQLHAVSGGVRDAASGLATGKRMHKPF